MLLSRTFPFLPLKKKKNLISRITSYNRSLQFLQKSNLNFKTFIIKLLLSQKLASEIFYIAHRILRIY